LVSKLEEKGTDVIFKNSKATIELADGSKVLSVAKTGRIYVVKPEKTSPETFIVQLSQKSTSFDTWYHCLAHAGEDIKILLGNQANTVIQWNFWEFSGIVL